MNTLFLHLSATAGDCRAWLQGSDGLADLGQGTPEHFVSLHPGSNCIVFIPSSSCLFVSAAVNARQLRQAGQSLAWLLEDQAGEDVEGLHVIAGPSTESDTPLIAISRTSLETLLARLRGNGLAVIAALPDLFLLPRDDSDWQLAQQGDFLALRTGEFSGAVLEVDTLELMLDGALAERTQKGPLTVSIDVAYADLGTRVETWASAHDDVSCRLADDLDVEAGLAAVPDWTRHPANLLQGGFAGQHSFRMAAGLRRAAIFVAAAFALQLLGEWVHYGYYKYQAGKVGERVVSRFNSLYADERVKPGSNALNEVQKRLRGKRNAGGDDTQVLPTLTKVAESLQGSGLATQRVDFLGGALTLDVNAGSLAELDSFKQKLDGQGFRTEIVSANNQGGVIRGRLRVEGGA
jgi:type II secretion system protein L